MATTAAPTRYTLNHDGTLEKWYLEHDGGEIIYLRKTPRPKWNCCMKEFSAAEVFPDYKTARAALKSRASAKIAPWTFTRPRVIMRQNKTEQGGRP